MQDITTPLALESHEGYDAWSLVASQNAPSVDDCGSTNYALQMGATRVRKAASDLLNRDDIAVDDISVLPLEPHTEFQQDSFVDLPIDRGLVVRTRAVYRPHDTGWTETPWLVALCRNCGAQFTASVSLEGLMDVHRQVQGCACGAGVHTAVAA